MKIITTFTAFNARQAPKHQARETIVNSSVAGTIVFHLPAALGGSVFHLDAFAGSVRLDSIIPLTSAVLPNAYEQGQSACNKYTEESQHIVFRAISTAFL